MWKLLQNIGTEDEQDLYLGTNDIFRPDLKQIGNSLFEIRSYFIENDGQSIVPTKPCIPFAPVKERLIEHIENQAYDFVFDPLTNEVVDLPNPKAGPCFMFLCHSLAVALDFYTSPRPSNTVCDVFLALPTQSVIVLSVVDGDEDCPEAVTYSMSVARGVIETLIKFTDEDISSIHGVIHISLLEDAVKFKNRLKKLANESSHFVTKDSLLMTPSRYEKVLTAFWAGVAETKSVLKEESGEIDSDYLKFLTKDQCIILVENINSKDVEVKSMPGSGATTLMLEVARRLNRLGDTLLVCRSRQERDRLRSVYPSAVAAEDLSMVDMSSCVNIVDETNTVMTQTSGHKWLFTTYLTDIKELKSHIDEAVKEIEGVAKQIDALSNESWKERIEHLLMNFSMLKMFNFKLGSTEPISCTHEVRHTLEFTPSPLTSSKDHYASGGFKQLSAIQEAWLSDIHDRLKKRENLVPLLRSVIIQDKTDKIYQDVKHALLNKAVERKKHTESRQSFAVVGHVESQDIQEQMETFHIESENAGMEPDVPPVRKEGGQINNMETEVQKTDVKDPENRWDEIQTLNQELDNLQKDKDRRKGQLHVLYTVEWQAVMEYLTRHKADLAMLDIEIPGFQVFQGLPDRQPSVFPGRVTSVQGSSAVSIVAHEDIGERFGPSKRKRRRLDVSESATSLSNNTNNGRDKVVEQRHTRAPGLMNQFRQYQQGRLTERHLCAITMKIIRKDEQQLKELKANNGSLEKDYGSSVHVVGLTRRPLLVSCPTLHLDAARANRRWCHVTTDGQLVNSPPDTRDEGQNRLQKYTGTCSSPIPLPPFSSTLTPLPTTPRYWETETRVRVGGVLFPPVLEMGLTEAGLVDSQWCVSLQRRSWCVSVWSCRRHERSYCTTVWREGERGECHQNTMSDTPGTQATLRYGVVLDVERGRVAFIDLNRQVVLVKYDDTFREPLVPMFSAGWPYSGHTSSMSLISGEDINMTDAKEALIYQALK
ncbi:uncharacterized protein [Haliotis asinina]|uniref:uncharacterized protein n=1 Tax=Haliotis asinina TaxID=109174 RepID=UPI00353265FC